jgi:3-hydroxyacyl-CoA dehydrogenase, NAD binding domain
MGRVSPRSVRAGLDVIVREVNDAAACAGRSRIEGSLNRGVKSGKLSALDRDAALRRVTVTTSLDELADRDLVIEAAGENPEPKAVLFADLDTVVQRTDAILATNTSSIPVIQVARSSSRPEQVVGLHFFNPALLRLPGALTGRPSPTAGSGSTRLRTRDTGKDDADIAARHHRAAAAGQPAGLGSVPGRRSRWWRRPAPRPARTDP